MSGELNFAGGGVHEIAALRPNGSLVAGCFDRADAADGAIAALGDRYTSVWSTGNRVATLPIGRALNPSRLTGGPRCKNGHMEQRYISLLHDYDPPRSKGVMSTQGELQAAIDQAMADREWLHSTLGWPRSPIGISGSGVQVRPRTDLEATPENIRLVARVLTALKQRSSFIDVGRYALNQLCRYFGTMNRKGGNDPERPWRMATVLDPGEQTSVTREQLISLCDAIGVPEVKSAGDGVARPEAQEKFVRRFEAFCDKVGAEITEVRTQSNGKILILTSPCLLHDDHDGGVGITADGVRCVQCFHNRCALGWSQWSRAVERKFGRPMRLNGEILWKK